MNIANLLFSFQGRIRRTHFWLAYIGTSVVIGVVVNVVVVMSGAMRGTVNPMVALLLLPFLVLDVWIGLALGVKRCHDRDKTGWFLAIGLIPLIGALWLLVELGFLDGTPGPNRYGASPKGVGGAALAA